MDRLLSSCFFGRSGNTPAFQNSQAKNYATSPNQSQRAERATTSSSGKEKRASKPAHPQPNHESPSCDKDKNTIGALTIPVHIDQCSDSGDEADSRADSQGPSPPGSPNLSAPDTKKVTITCSTQVADVIRDPSQDGYFHPEQILWLHEELEVRLRDTGIIEPEILEDAKEVNRTGDELILPKVGQS